MSSQRKPRKVSQETNTEERTFIPHWRAIPTFIAFTIMNLQVAMTVSAFTPIEPMMGEFLDCKTSTVVLTSTLFLIGTAVSVFYVYPLIKHYSMQLSVQVGLVFNILGSGLRTLAYIDMNFLLIGQLVIGFATCAMYNNQMEFCYNWFDKKIRPVFIAIITVSVYIGGGIGNTIPLIWINISEIETVQQAKHALWVYNFGMFLIIAGLSLITLIIFRGKPPKGYG